jgi:hypothetical protein
MGEARRRRAESATDEAKPTFTRVVFLRDDQGRLNAARPAPSAIDIMVAHQTMLLRDQRGERVEATVPCNGCTACCHARVTVNAAEERPEDLAVLDLVSDGEALVLRRRADGDCVHLDAADGCTVYAARPKVCRQFDCRVHATCGLRQVFPDPTHAAPPWVLAQATQPDRKLLHALAAARVDYIRQRGPDWQIDDATNYAWAACRRLVARLFPTKFSILRRG